MTKLFFYRNNPAAVLRDDVLRGQVHGATYDAGNIPEIVTVPRHYMHVGCNFFVTAQTLPIYETAFQYTGPVILVHGTADRACPILLASATRTATKMPNVFSVFKNVYFSLLYTSSDTGSSHSLLWSSCTSLL